MTDYLKLAQETPQAPAADPANPYLDLAKQDQVATEARTRTVLEMALKDKPDVAAERQRLAKSAGLPLPVVERNLEQVRLKEQARQIDLIRMAQDSPVLMRQLGDPTFTTTAIDDLDTLTQIEKSVGNAVRYMMGAAPGGGITGDLKASLFRSSAAAAGVQRAAVDVIEPWARLVAGDDNWFKGASDWLTAQGKAANATADRMAPVTGGNVGKGVSSGVQSFAMNAKYLPLAALGPAGAVGALGAMVAESFGTSYNKAADANLPLWQSLGYASADAMVEYWTEKLPLDALIGGIKQGAPFIKVLGKQMALEIPGEQLATTLQDLNEWAVLNPGKPFSGYLAERPDAIVQTLIATVIGTGGNVMVTTGIGKVADSIYGTQWRDNVTTSYQEMLDEQLKLAGGSLLRERSPEQFRAHVQAVVDQNEGAPKSIHVDGEVLNQLPDELKAQLPQGVRDRIEEAAATGDTVEIPMADVLTLAPGTPLEQVLNEHARMDPFAQSMADVKMAAGQAQELLKQEAERVVQQASDQEAMRASAEVVRTTILSEINATGRYRPAVAEGMSQWAGAFYTTMAARTGMTPEQFYAKHKLRILGAPSAAAAGPVMDQGKLGEISVEGYHYSKADRPVISTALFGTGLQGSSRDEYLNAADKRLSKRAYFYADKGTGITPESGVGGRAHRAQLTNVYDSNRDPLGLKQGPGGKLGFESRVLDAGFSGYLDRLEGTQPGQVIMLGDQLITPEILGPQSRIETGKRVPAMPQTEPQWTNYATGTPEEMQAQLERMQAKSSWQAYDLRVEGGALQYRKKEAVFNQSDRVKTGPDLFRNVIDVLGLSDAEVASTAIEFMTGLPGDMAFLPPAVGGIPDVVQFLHARRLESGLPVLDISKPEDRTQLARLMAAEGLAAITSAGNALAWYDQTIRETLSQMGVKYPELNTNLHARNAFLMAMAITSQGMNVETNLGAATELYDAYRLTVDANGVGKFPERGWGESASQMTGNLRLANELLVEMGPDLLRRFLATPFTVKELTTAGFDVGGELMDEVVLGSSVFGPKIGFGFYSNLSGNFDPVTMDMWFMRTQGRLAGTLPAMDPAKFKNQLARFRAGLKEKGPKGQSIFAAQLDKEAVKAAMKDDAAAVALARKINSMHQKDFKGNRALFDSGVRKKSEMVLAAGTILQSMDKPTDAPTSGGERRLLRDVVQQATALVSDAYGNKVPSAAFQALIWYPEQELYSALGVKLAVTSQDYSGGAAKILTAEGYSEQQLADARAAAKPGPGSARPADGQPDTGTAGGNGQVVGGAGPLTLDERTRFITERNARIIAEQRAAAARVNFEVAPDPNDLDLVSRWRLLSQQARLAVSDRVVQQILPKVLKALKAKGALLPQVGSYLDDTNPSFALRLDKGDVAQVAKTLGFILSQDSMMALAPVEFDGAFKSSALRVQVGEKTPEEIDQIYQALRKIEVDGRQVIGGQSTSGGIMTILLDAVDDVDAVGVLVTEALAGAYNVTGHDVFAAFPEKQDYDYGVPESDPAGDEGLARQRARDARAQATELLRKELDAADAAESAAAAAAAANGPFAQGVAQTDTPEFQAWFGDSKVATSAGAPQVVYRGTKNPSVHEGSLEGKTYATRMPLFTTSPAVASGYAEGRPRDKTALDAPTVAPVYLAISNPLDTSNIPSDVLAALLAVDTNIGSGDRNKLDLARWRDTLAKDSAAGRSSFVWTGIPDAIVAKLEELGYDGIKDKGGKLGGEQHTVWMPFKSGQVKSAIGNDGSFDRGDPDMLSQEPQQPRGTFNPATLELVLNPNANLSTFFHETGHFFLEVMADIASQPNAPAQIVEDMNTFLKWAGVKDLATWNALDLDGKRKYHERWAESVEQYVMEGKAPSVELQPLMRRFSTWLKSVYGSIQKMLQARGAEADPAQLNDDIRRVMDRMLATDEQIAQANEVAGLVPDVDADAAAAERLNKRSMADLKWSVRAHDQAITKLKKQAAAIEKGIREEVTLEVDQMPEARAKAALDALQVDTEYDGVLSAYKAERKAAEVAARDEVKAALLGENPDAKGLVKGQLLMKNKRDIDNKVDAAMIKWDAANPRPSKAKYATEMDLAMVADSFEYESVDAMLQSIDAFDRRDLIEGMTDQRMLEEHGDLIDERAISEAANEAVHNEARARSLATELRTQREMLNPRQDTGETNAKGSKITVNALVEAAKQFAANVVARATLRDLKAKAWQHTAAERRAAKRWQDATAAGKTEEAVKAKQDQMLNHAAAKAAIDARAEAAKIFEFFKRVTKGNNETVVEKGRDADIVNAARAVLAAYGVETGTTKTAADYLETLSRNDPETYNVVAPMVEGATRNAQPLDALTFEELQALNEEIQAMWFLAKRSRQMEVDGDLLDRQDIAEELFARMEVIGIPDRVPGEGRAVTKAEARALFLRQGVSFLRRVEQWAEGMDGKFGGPFLRYVFQPVKLAADRYRADRVVYRKKLQALVDNIAPIVGDQVIKAPELGNAPDGRPIEFGTPGSTRGTAMNEILHAIIHTGNESNKRKLLLGRGWATENADGTLDTTVWDGFLQRLINEGKLERAHFDFVQGVWDLLEETKPLAQKTHRDVFGRYFAEVTADAFVDPFGVPRRGGYAPAVVDPAQVSDNKLRKLAEAENESMAYAFPAPNKGFTKGRVEYNRPLLLDLRTLGQHIDKVLLFSHMTQPASDVRKLLTDKMVGQTLDRIDPSAIESMLQPWLQRSAQQVVETPILGGGSWGRVPSVIRARAGAALMFANVSNAIQQVTGLILGNVKVKRSHMMRAMAQHVAHPVKAAQAVWAASTYMDDRAKNEVAVMNEQMQDILLKPSVYEKAQNWSMRHAYFLQTGLDNALSPIIWTGAYNQAMTEGMEHDDAVRFADGAIRQTQGSTLPEDVSRFETGHPALRAFTQFIGYFNMVANTNGTALKNIANEVGLKNKGGRAFSVVMMGLLVPIWAAEAIALAFRGGPEDEDKDGYLDDWLASVFGFGTARGLLAMIPVAGQAINAAITTLDNNPMNDRISLSPGLSLIESTLTGNVQTVREILDSDKEVNARRAVRDVATLVSVFTGLPAYAVARPAGYLAGIADGKIEPTGPVDAARGLLTGTASPESKQ